MSPIGKLGGRMQGWPNWTTPAHVLERVRRVAHDGVIALDPCSNEASTVGARVSWTRDDDALDARSWTAAADGGLIFCNPEYGRIISAFVAKCAEEADRGAEIVALLPARTGAMWMHEHVLSTCDAWLLWRGRIAFGNPPPGSAGTSPSVESLIAYWGEHVDRFASAFEDAGHLVISVPTHEGNQ